LSRPRRRRARRPRDPRGGCRAVMGRGDRPRARPGARAAAPAADNRGGGRPAGRAPPEPAGAARGAPPGGAPPDPRPPHARPPGIIRTGRAILAELVSCVGDGAAPRARSPDPVHRQLAALWQLDDAGADLVRRCLVLLADHELNASTFVARCVASTGATPYAVVSAALGALSGRRHGGASVRAEALLREIGDSDAMALMAARLTRGDSLPGIRQPVDPH